MRRFLFRSALISSIGALSAACGSEESPGAAAPTSDGGPSTGGAGAGSGGSSASGGAGGSRSSGGAGGASAGGANAGGASALGGSNAGGASGAGGAGAASNGGSGASTDGGPSTEGSSGSGGSNAGGAAGSGGATTGTGGAQNDGGATSTNIFVNPATGSDNNYGLSAAEAVKTISKAAQLAGLLSGTATIYLEDGTYDSSTQPNLNVTFPGGTIVRALASTGVTVHGTTATNGFVFAGGGGIRNVTFDTFAQGVRATGTGTFNMTDVHFSNVTQPMSFQDSIVATIDAGSAADFAVAPSTGFGPACVVADDTSTVNFRSGEFRNVPGNDGEIFRALKHAKLTIDTTVFDTMTVRAVTIFDNADVVLMNSQIHGVSVASPGVDAAAIYMGGQNTQAPIDPSLDVESSDITMNQVRGVTLLLYGGFASKPVIKFTSSHIDNNAGQGLLVTAVSPVDATLVNTIQVIGSTFKNNTLHGMTAPVGTVSITGGEFSGNGADGIALTGSALVNSLKVRGTVKIDANGGHGIWLGGSASSALDLGKTADPGGITFTAVAAGHSAVNLQAPIQGFAVGNTWMPNVQGASAAGLYSSPTTITGPASDLNATIVSGGSLVVAE